MPLEGGLHPDVPLRADIVSGDENLLHPFRYSLYSPHLALLSQGFHQLIAENPLLFGDLLKEGIYFHQFVSVQYVAEVAQREKGLDAAGAAGDDAERAGGGNGGPSGVPHPRCPAFVVDAALEGREDASRSGQLHRGGGSFLLDELHDALAGLDGLFAIVRDSQPYQHIGKAHHPQPDLTSGLSPFRYLGEGKLIYVDYIVQESDGRFRY
ncbi:MAG: hypothetical protein DDT27_01445 [Dehalococcoidia bacterium]|nr:hypothetical protein [Chloroflexota bacterium]